MVGSFKILCYLSLFGLLLSCKENVGEEIINQNFNYFITDLPVFPSDENPDGVIPIVVFDSITRNNFIINDCSSDCFKKINTEGFGINRNTKYTLFTINKLPNDIKYKKIRLIQSDKNLDIKDYIELYFSNLYIDNKIGKSFIIVEKYEHGGKSSKTEAYFFKKEEGKWKFYKKELLLIG
ncbi:hypothetical protein [Chryseobacterium koreense]|uniref:hypothetical protein n=1 Tax=Chryseobacterium koreense TaxID=232216 RepID=UPI0026E95821|nr:hypothetical protein [Chryseobacterium koreense]